MYFLGFLFWQFGTLALGFCSSMISNDARLVILELEMQSRYPVQLLALCEWLPIWSWILWSLRYWSLCFFHPQKSIKLRLKSPWTGINRNFPLEPFYNQPQNSSRWNDDPASCEASSYTPEDCSYPIQRCYSRSVWWCSCAWAPCLDF